MAIPPTRDIPSLYTLTIKAIAKQPNKFICETKFLRAIKIIQFKERDSFVQNLLDRSN